MFSVEVLGEGVDVPDVDTRALAAPDGIGDGVHAAAGPRAAPRARQEQPHGHRPHRPAASRVPLRGPAQGDSRRAARDDPRAGRGRVPVPAGRMHRRSRPPEPGDHPRQPEVGRTAFALVDAGRGSESGSRTESGSPSFLRKHDHRLEDIYKQRALLDAAEARRAALDGRASDPEFERADASGAWPDDPRR